MSTQTAAIKTLDANRFKNCVFFSLTLRRQFGNRGRVTDGAKLAEYIRLLEEEIRQKKIAGEKLDKTAVALDAPPFAASGVAAGTIPLGSALKASKTLMRSEALDNINEHMNATKEKLVGRFGMASQSRIKEGLFVATIPQVEEFETILAEAQDKLQEELVPAFLMDFPQAQGRAQAGKLLDGGLGPLYDAADYGTAAEYADAFAFEWQWLALSVPEGLPGELKAAAQQKLDKQFSDAADEISAALRVGFQKIIEHAANCLKVEPNADAKPKAFKNTLIGNIESFIQTFNNRNIMNDAELAVMVDKARNILANGNNAVTAEALRKDAALRESMAAKFAEINTSLTAMVETTASRKFDFSE